MPAISIYRKQHLLVAFMAMVLVLTACGQQDITVTDAYVRAPIPGKQVTAGFMRINNNRSNAIELLSVSSTASRQIEMHEHRHHNGTMRMREVDAISIAPGEQTALEPGGYHLMIFGMENSLTSGDSMALELAFSDGSSLTVNATIKPLF